MYLIDTSIWIDYFRDRDNAGVTQLNLILEGITIRSSADCLIAQIAIEHDLTLLHNDKDYENIRKEIKTLKLA